MPYCTNCGTEVPPHAFFCGHCGKAQPQTGAPPMASAVLSGISARTASILCYIPVFGVIPAIIVLAAQKFRHHADVRFNAFQSVYLFVAWLIVSSAMPVFLTGMPGWGVEHSVLELVKLAFLICWIYLLVKAAHQEQIRLPVIGDLAARSAIEQL